MPIVRGMAQISVGTTAVALPVTGRQTVVIQNLSVNAVYVDAAAAVTAGTGIKIAAGAILDLPGKAGFQADSYYVIADGANSDVRYIALG